MMQRFDRRTFLRGGLLTAGALAVASCSKSSNESGTKPPAGRPTIRFSGGVAFGIPQPFNYLAAPGYQLMIYMYDALLQEDTNGKMLPLLANSWERSSDGLTYTFQLRDGLEWVDGTPVTPDDVVFTFDYYARSIIPPNVIVRPEFVAGAQATGPNTVEVTLNVPAVTWERAVAGTLPIVPKHIWEPIADPAQVQDLSMLVGTGPYRLDKFSEAEGTYLYLSNDQYFLGRPYVARIEYLPVPLDDPLAAIQTGEVDVADMPPYGTPNRLLAPFSNSSEYGIEETPAAIALPLKWNLAADGAKGEILRDPRFRKACAKAINREELLRRVAGGNGLPGNPGYLPSDNEWYVPVEQYAFDPAAANQMLDAAGYTRSGSGTREGPDGQAMSFGLSVVNDIPTAVQERLVADLRDVGVSVTPNPVSLVAAISNSSYEMALSFDGDVKKGSDPDHLRLVYSSTSPNFAHPIGYSNPRMDELCDRQLVTFDTSTRREIVNQIQQLAAEDLPVLPIYYPDQFSIYKKSAFQYWSESDTGALTELKRNLMTGEKSGLSIRPAS